MLIFQQEKVMNRVRLFAITTENKVFEVADIGENAVILKVNKAQRVLKKEAVKEFFTSKEN